MRYVDVTLTREDLDALDAASALRPEYPGWMMDRQSRMRPRQEPRPA